MNGKKNKSIGLALALGMLAAFLQLGFSGWVVRSLAQDMVSVLQKTLGRIAEHAYRTNDDLILQEIAQGLSLSPGVRWACLVDENRKILANREPTSLGKPLSAVHPNRDSGFTQGWLPARRWQSALYVRSQRWGWLAFELSGERWRSLLLAQLILLALTGGLGLILFSFNQSLWQRASQEDGQKIEALSRQLEEKNGQLARLEGERFQQQTLHLAELQSALEQIPQPILLLNQYQKIAGLNTAARNRLGVLIPLPAYIGQSWQDVPLLSQAGAVLQQSLESPDKIIETVIGDHSLRLRTEWLAPDSTPQTWVFL